MKHVVFALLFIVFVIGSIWLLIRRDLSSGSSSPPVTPATPSPAATRPATPRPPPPVVSAAPTPEEVAKVKAEVAAQLKAAEAAKARQDEERALREEARLRRQAEAEEARRKKAEQDLARRAGDGKALDEKRAAIKANAEKTLALVATAVQRLKGQLALKRTTLDQQDEQRKVSQARLNSLVRIAETKQKAAGAIQPEMMYVCSKCGRDRQAAFTSKCAYCKSSMSPTDVNTEARERAQQDAAKAQEAIAVEQTRLQRLQPTEAQAEATQIEARLNGLKASIAELERIVATCDQADAAAVVQLAYTVGEYAKQANEVLASLGVSAVDVAQPPRPVPSQPATTQPPPKPAKRKVYTLADGKTLEVVSEMDAGSELVIKTPDGEVHNVAKKDIVKKE
jgi:hypothetical protein